MTPYVEPLQQLTHVMGPTLKTPTSSTGGSEGVDSTKDMPTRDECRALGTTPAITSTSSSSSSSSSSRSEENHLEVMKAIRGVMIVKIAQTCSHLVGVVEEIEKAMKASSLPTPKFTIPPPQFPFPLMIQAQQQHQPRQQPQQQPKQQPQQQPQPPNTPIHRTFAH